MRLSLGEPAPSEPKKPLPWAHDRPPDTDSPLLEVYRRAFDEGAALRKSRCVDCGEPIPAGAVHVDDGFERWHKDCRPPFGLASAPAR